MEIEESLFCKTVWPLRVCSKCSVEVAMKGMNCNNEGKEGFRYDEGHELKLKQAIICCTAAFY